MAGGLQVQLRAAGPIRMDAEFDCGPGELVALVGPSGSGKTSMLRAVAGLWSPHRLQGRISCGGQVWLDTAQGIGLSPQQRRVGLVFQHYALFPHMDVLANVALAADQVWHEGDVRQLLERVGLAGLLQRRPAQLSGGQQQRVALARALVRVMPAPPGGDVPGKPPHGLQQEPPGSPLDSGQSRSAPAPGVLLLDEPFSAVDAPTRQSLYRELAAWRQQVAVPMLLVTHDLQEARRLADRVVIVDAGQTLQAGPPDKVFASPRNARVAELVGIQNHFQGRFHKQAGGWAHLQWLGARGRIDLQVIDKNRIDDGTPVTWVLNGEHVDLLPADAEPGGANRVPCALREVLALGDISLCTFSPLELPDQRITLNLMGRVLARMGVGPGSRVCLVLAPQALHIMPVRGLG